MITITGAITFLVGAVAMLLLLRRKRLTSFFFMVSRAVKYLISEE